MRHTLDYTEMPKKQDILRRPNETIGMVPHHSGMRLEANERKIYAAILLISQGLGDQKRYEYPLNELLRLCNLSFTNTARVKEQLTKIRAFTMDYNNREGIPHWKPLGLVTTLGIVGNLEKQHGRTVVAYWELEDVIKERLMHPDGFFTRMSLQMATRLSSGSSVALYEIAAAYATNYGGLSARYEIQHFIKILLGENLKEEREWRFFKRDTLKNAIREVNEITDLTVEIKEFKTRQKITHVQLIVTVKKKEEISEPLSQVEDLLTQQIQKLGIDLFDAVKIVKNKANSTEKIARQIEIASKATPKNPLAYLKAGLRENYQKPAKALAPSPALAAVIAPVIDSALIEKRKYAFESHLAKTHEEQKASIDDWLAKTNSTMRNFYKTRGFENRPAREDFITSLMQKKE